jgi:hypothetical protein
MNQVGLWKLDRAVLSSSSGNTDFVDIVTGDYQYYKVFINTTAVSTTLAIRMQLLTGTSPVTGTNYNFYVKSYVGVNEITQTGQTSFMVLQGFSTVPNQATSFDVLNPGIASHTFLQGTHNGTTATGGLAIGAYAGIHTVATGYDGFRFFPSTGNFSGAITVYGYNT